MPVKIVFRRHAHRSLAQGSASGHTLLTPRGKFASKRVGQLLKRRRIKPKIYHSTIERTRETALKIKAGSKSPYALRVRKSIGRFRKKGASHEVIDQLFKTRPENEIIQGWLDGKHRDLFISPAELARGVVHDMRLAVRADKKYPDHSTRLDVIGHDITLMALFQTLTGQKIPSRVKNPKTSRDYVEFLEPLTINVTQKNITLFFRKKKYDVTKSFFELMSQEKEIE